jgi:hypothetical protein
VEADGLALHPDKTHLGDCRQPGQGFEFPGVQVRSGSAMGAQEEPGSPVFFPSGCSFAEAWSPNRTSLIRLIRRGCTPTLFPASLRLHLGETAQRAASGNHKVTE